MKATRALEGLGESDITPAVLALGRPLFSQALIGTLPPRHRQYPDRIGSRSCVLRTLSFG